MNKTELVSAIAEQTLLSKKDCEAVLNATLDAITDALSKGDKVVLMGFGTFETRERAARTGRIPKTNEVIEIPAATVPAFKAGKALKDKVNK